MLFLLILPSADFRASYSQGNANLPKTSAGFSEVQKKSRRQIALLAKLPAISPVQSCHSSGEQGAEPCPVLLGVHRGVSCLWWILQTTTAWHCDIPAANLASFPWSQAPDSPRTAPVLGGGALKQLWGSAALTPQSPSPTVRDPTPGAPGIPFYWNACGSKGAIPVLGTDSSCAWACGKAIKKAAFP